jgi:hypothetical protein
VTDQTFNVGDFVLVDGATTSRRVARTEGNGVGRLYWIEVLSPTRAHDSIGDYVHMPTRDGIAHPDGPITADRLKPA